MKPAWDQLGSEYKDSSSVVIGDADCTADGKELCTKFGVSGYPTVKYFTAETGADGTSYNGGRDYESLKKFTEETLAGGCDIADVEGSGCDEREQKYITKMRDQGAAGVAKQLARLEKMKGGKMKPALKVWLVKRLALLQQLDAIKDEL